jgi:hypothetical protein
MSCAAVSTLGKVMVDQNSPASTRVRAAECILNQGAKAIEIEIARDTCLPAARAEATGVSRSIG